MAKFLAVVLASSFLLILLVGTIDGVRNGTSFPKSRKFKRDSNPGFNGFLDSFSNQYFRTDYSLPPRSPPSRDAFDDSISLFNFPVGTKLTLTPAINVPITMMPGVITTSKTNINLELPMEVVFNKFDWRRMFRTKADNIYHPHDGGFEIPNPYQHQQHDQIAVESNEIGQQRLLSRKLRDLGGETNYSNRTIRKLERSSILDQLLFGDYGRCPSKSFSDRRGILQKMELLVGSVVGYSESPRDCLLRWTCELHKNIGIAKQYGLIGEAVVLMFSMGEISRDCDKGSSQLKYFKPFIKAEVLGKSGKCLVFEKKCSQSLFAF